MDLSREQALSILGLAPSASDEEAVRAYTRQKQPLKRMLVRAASVDLKNEYRGRLRELVQARDVALGRSDLDDRTRKLRIEERPLLSSLRIKVLDRERAFQILGLAQGAPDGDVMHAYTERYRFLTQRLGLAKENERLVALRNARVRLLGVRRFLLERTETLDLTSVFAEDFMDDEEEQEKEDAQAALEEARVEEQPSAPDEGHESDDDVEIDERDERDGDVEIEEDDGEPGLDQTRPIPVDDAHFDLNATRTSFALDTPDPGDWAGDESTIRATFDRLVGPLREHISAAKSDELKQGYDRAIKELQRRRDEALRQLGD